MILYLVRHGATTWNRDGLCQGQTDVPLSDVGRGQARALAARMAALRVDRCVSSDLSRASETARILAGSWDLPVEEDARLREIHFGTWEGRASGDLDAEVPVERAAWRSDAATFRPPGGETLTEVQARVVAVLDELAAQPAEASVLAVSHGYALLTGLCHLLGLPLASFRRLWLDPTGLCEVRLGGSAPSVRRLNDRSHLDPRSPR